MAEVTETNELHAIIMLTYKLLIKLYTNELNNPLCLFGEWFSFFDQTCLNYQLFYGGSHDKNKTLPIIKKGTLKNISASPEFIINSS